MAKFRQGNLVLASTEKIIQGTSTLIDANGVAQLSSLVFLTGATINEFSTDVTLSDDSNTAIPTEHAIKYYTDTSISNIDRTLIVDGNNNIQVFDTTASHADIVIDSVTVGIFSASGLSIETGGLTLPSGATINEFSTDGTLVDDSDSAVPTEKAVKTYVDSYLDKIFQGDSKVQVYDDSTSHIDAIVDNGIVASFKVDGFALASGATINEFSTDITLAGDSDTVVPTEHAVKTYIDGRLPSLDYEKQVGSDSTDNTIFILSSSYTLGSHRLLVFVNGQKAEQVIAAINSTQYEETDTNTITFGAALQDSDIIEFYNFIF